MLRIVLHISSVSDHVVTITEQPSVSLWHGRLGHMSETGMKVLSRLGYLPCLRYADFEHCDHCIYGKHVQTSHKKSLSLKSSPLELVHSDVCQMPGLSLGGKKYLVTFVDDATRKVWVYPIRSKDEVLDKFRTFLALVENQIDKTLKCLRSDNGGEYVSKAFQAFCDSKGIKRELTAPYNPPQNGVAERMNRTIQDKVRTMLSHAALPHGFWAEAVMTAVHLINRSPNRSLGGGIPQEAWSGKPPSYAHLRVFGCEAFVHIRKEERNKLEPKSCKCIFLGYGDEGEMGYRLWDPEKRKIVRSNDVIFRENRMHKQPEKTEEVRRVVFREEIPFRQENVPAVQQQTPAVNLPANAENEVGNDQPAFANNDEPPNVQEQLEQQAVNADLQAEMPGLQIENDDLQAQQLPNNEHWVRRSSRVTRQPDRFVPDANSVADYVMVTDCGEPTCFKEAMDRQDNKKWYKAMLSEMESLEKNDTWDLVQLPKGQKTLPCKWVYKMKVISDSSPKYKARLVAKGYKQEYGVDFDEIFSPVVKMTTLRIILGLVAAEDMELIQMDVKTAFLHGDLHEDIYMQQPEGFVAKGKEKMVCKLKRSLYGLKQAPREWYHKFDAFMQSQGFRRSQVDHCLYTKKAGDGSLIILVLYVDDMLIAGKDIHALDSLKQSLHGSFDMKDLGDANHILGMRILRNRSKGVLFLSQQEYISKVLQRFNMEGGKTIGVPLPPYLKLSAEDSPTSDDEKAEMAKVPYASAVGSLIYAMVATRPDIAFAVGVVSRYMANPGKKHWEAVKGIMRYLKGTKDLGICFGKQKASVVGFTDADYAGHADCRKSTSGYVFTFTGGAVSWISRLQKCVALSTTEAEYVAATEACKEALWLSYLVRDLGITELPILHCDSQSAIMLARNPVFHAKTKHIEVKYHFIRDVLDSKNIELVKVHTNNNPADLLTKGLPAERFAHCRQMMGVG